MKVLAQIGSYVLDLSKEPVSLLVGKSSFLLELMTSIVLLSSPSEVNIHILGRDIWGKFVQLPHVLSYAQQSVNLAQFLDRLEKEGEDRLKAVDKDNLPLIIALVDDLSKRLKELKEQDKSQYEKVQGQFARLLALSKKTGIHFVIASEDLDIPPMLLEEASLKVALDKEANKALFKEESSEICLRDRSRKLRLNHIELSASQIDGKIGLALSRLEGSQWWRGS